MKNLLNTLMIILTIIITFTACQKEGPIGPQGEQGIQGEAGPSAKTFNFTISYFPGDIFKTYSGITNFDADDMILVFTEDASSDEWIPLPCNFGSAEIRYSFNGQTGKITLYTYDNNGAAYSPWTGSTNVNYKAVLIKSSQKIKQPDLNMADYKKVKEIFNLND